MQTRTTRELNYDVQETFDQNIFILIYNKQKVAKGLLLSAVFSLLLLLFFEATSTSCINVHLFATQSLVFNSKIKMFRYKKLILILRIFTTYLFEKNHRIKLYKDRKLRSKPAP